MARRWIERLALVGLGLVLAFFVLEAALQIGAAYMRRTTFDRPSQWTRQARRVLCLGDSNTYGTKVAREQAYPAVLERLWIAEAGRPAVEVLNLGVPGANSSRLRNNFRALLAELRPELVLVLVGANDSWTVAAPAEKETPLTLQQRLWQRSRVFRLLFMLWRSAAPPDARVVVERPGDDDARALVRIGQRELDLTWTGKAASRTRAWQRALASHLNDMRAACVESACDLVLLTYASQARAYAQANRVIRAARADDLPVIDVAQTFSAICPDERCADLLFADGHPTRLGYQVVAATVRRGLGPLGGDPGRREVEASWTAVLDPEVRRALSAVPPD